MNMHLLVAIAPHLHGDDESVDKFIRYVQEKEYDSAQTRNFNPAWKRVKPREIRLYDLTVPESVADEVIKDLYPYEKYNKMGTIQRLLDIPLLSNLAFRTLGLRKIDKGGLDANRATPHPVRLCLIGMLEDEHKVMNGQFLEML